MGTVGIAITTRNRPEVLDFTCDQFRKYDKGLTYLVVDDNSDERYDPEIGDYIYNKQRLGIAKSKNRCIKNLDTDHVFLFDDDCFPIKDDWWVPWVTAGVDYLVFALSLQHKLLRTRNGLNYWSNHHGCAIYMSRKAIKTLGGFDPEFGMYGFEHAELTHRAYKSGLIPHQYITPVDMGLWSFDAQGSYGGYTWEHRSAISQSEKEREIDLNREVWKSALGKDRIFVEI